MDNRRNKPKQPAPNAQNKGAAPNAQNRGAAPSALNRGAAFDTYARGATPGSAAKGVSPGTYTGRRAAPADTDVKYEPTFHAALAGAANPKIARPGSADPVSNGFNAAGLSPDGYNRAGLSPDAYNPAGPSPAEFAAAMPKADLAARKLADVLEREALLYGDAAEISAKKTDVIVHGKIEELDSLVKAEQAIILKIGRLENEREAAITEFSGELGMDLGRAALSDIGARLGGESYSRLDRCRKSLADTLGSLKNTNDVNSQLIQNALDYVNFSVNLIASDQNAGNTYSQGGDEGAPKQRRSIFDVKL